MAVQPCPVCPPERPFRGWPSCLARFIHRNSLSVDGRPVLPGLSTGTAFPWMAVQPCPVCPPERPFRGWPSCLARFIHRNSLSVDGRPVLPGLSTGTAFPWMAVQPCPVCPPELPFPWMRVGENTKKMSVDASRVDSHSNHIINNTKTNNQ